MTKGLQYFEGFFFVFSCAFTVMIYHKLVGNIKLKYMCFYSKRYCYLVPCVFYLGLEYYAKL